MPNNLSSGTQHHKKFFKGYENITEFVSQQANAKKMPIGIRMHRNKVGSGNSVTIKKSNSCIQQIYYSPQISLSMAENYRSIVSSETIPGCPMAAYDQTKLMMVHVYQNVPLDTSNFQRQVTSYLNRKESLSKNVATVFKIKDEHISYDMGVASLKVSIVTDYVPWRFQLYDQQITYEEALFILNGSLRGFRELLHRTRTPFIIKDYMIGVDGSGEVKVWWNHAFYNSTFGFPLNGDIKLEDMLKSLISLIVNKMTSDQGDKLEKVLMQGQISYSGLLERIKQISKGLNLQIFGLKLVKKCKEYPLVMQQQTDLISSRAGSIINDQLRLSKLSCSPSRLILSPPPAKKKLEFEKDKNKLITKRIFQNGNTPREDQKLQMIKQDIEQLREVTQERTEASPDQKLRPSKSIGSIYSFKKGLYGNITIPEVHKIIKESQVIGPKEEVTISRFVDPAPKNNPEMCGVCSQLSLLRKVQSFGQTGQNEASSPLLMLKLNSLGSDKPEITTPRSLYEFSPQRLMSPKAKFGESQVKQPSDKLYFSSVMEL